MITISIGNIWSEIRYDHQDASPLKNILNFGLKVSVPGARYTYLFKKKLWDGKARLWEDLEVAGEHVGVIVRTGLISRLTTLLDSANIQWQRGSDWRALPTNYTLQQTQVKLRGYQYEAVSAAFGNVTRGFGWSPRGVIEVATGGGKTEIAVAMYEMNPVPTFFLVHRKDLLIQAKERFEQYGHTVGIIGNGEFKVEPGINIATMQTLKIIFEEPGSTRAGVLAALMQDCEQVFFDECHLMASSEEKGNEFISVADKFDVPFRWGLTATPFMRTQYDNMLLEGVAGAALYKISSKQLVDLGHLTPPKVTMRYVAGKIDVTVPVKIGKRPTATDKWRAVESACIKTARRRTELIIDEMVSGPFPCLVLVKTVEQADFIKMLMAKRGLPEVPFLSGKNSASSRRQAVQQMREGELDVLLVTTIFDEGVDIPELAKVILASGGKSAVKTVQRVGRCLRTADGKEEAIIIDFQDSHHKMVRKHALARMKIYKEQEYEVIVEKKK